MTYGEAAHVETNPAADIELMLAYAIRDPLVCSKAVTVIKPEMFGPLEWDLSNIWAIAKDWYLRTREPLPGIDYFLAELNRTGWPERALPGDIDKIVKRARLLFEVYEVDKEFSETILVSYVQKFVSDRGLRRAMEAAITQDNVDAGFDMLKKVREETIIVTKAAVDPFNLTEGEKTFTLGPPFATGFELFDKLTNGGVRKRTLVGVLSPTGIGKSTTACCLAVKLAMQRERAIIFTYETTANPEFRNRIWSNYLGLSTDLLEVGYANLPPEIREEIDSARELGGYIDLVDMTEGPASGEGVLAVDSILKDRVLRCGTPRVVIIDWLGALVAKHMTAKNAKSGDVTNISNQVLTELRSLATKYDTCVVVTHQVNTDAGKRGVRAKGATGYEARNTGSFSDYCAFAFAFGQKDFNGVSKVTKTKGRGGGLFSVWARIHGDEARIELLNGTHMIDIDAQTDEEFWAAVRD